MKEDVVVRNYYSLSPNQTDGCLDIDLGVLPFAALSLAVDVEVAGEQQT